MRTAEALTDSETDPAVATDPWWRRAWLLILGTVAATWLLVGAASYLFTINIESNRSLSFLKNRWLNAWARWDAGWYHSIASNGYSYEPGKESSIAFFPTYPLLMRWISPVFGNDYVAGIVITVASGIGYLFLAWKWFSDHLGRSAAWTALLLLCWYPFAFYLYGAVYSDALFALLALGAFVLLEKDRPVLAGLVGAAASAARPVGIAVIAGLVILTLTRRNVFQRTPKFAIIWRNLRWKDAGVLLSVLGTVAYMAYLGLRFGDPLAFLSAEAGWSQAPGWQTWLKVPLFKQIVEGRSLVWDLRVGLHMVMGLTALALIPRVWKRFGVAYAVFAFIIAAIPVISTKDFFSTGRYMLPAFPCFAAAADILHSRRKLRIGVLAGFLGILILYTVLYAQGYYVA